ncbi:Vacuolar membrane protein [Wallemia ichthyophaga EXF-994]|uniref:Vacuolar membrane protein n=1 Tax=Wallemia ichthyophaga (strain EXF-994 / CBS 113033) TaxID=1299270 RepID=R9AU73_WALI9|nr:Vacuolar membrane protein [Wallemia ichthyophaga EXF-994]EOR03646.1 Vacuolar membrane protein [Wallemia ichthyophaga EXF-994]
MVLRRAPELDDGSCRLLGPVALGVQALMGLIVIGALVFKRYRESIRRPWKVWLCDVSKQIIGQAFVHAFNLLVSDLFAVHGGRNPCSGYFLNISIDTTVGVLIIYGLMKLFHWILVTKLNKQRFHSGHYGSPPSILFYVLILTLMKLLVVASLALFPFIFSVSDFLLDEMGPNAQVIISMCVWPLIMNVMQFWLIDSLIKSKTTPQDNGFRAQTSLDDFDVGDDDDDDDTEHQRFLTKPNPDDEEEVGDEGEGDDSRSMEEGRRRDDGGDDKDGGVVKNTFPSIISRFTPLSDKESSRIS